MKDSYNVPHSVLSMAPRKKGVRMTALHLNGQFRDPALSSFFTMYKAMVSLLCSLQTIQPKLLQPIGSSV